MGSKSLEHCGHRDCQQNRPRKLMAFAILGILFGAATLGLIVTTLSVRALSAHVRQLHNEANSSDQSGVEKFVGIWIARVSDMSATKEDLPPPFRDLPPDLVVAELTLKLEGERLSGTRILYAYTKAADGSAVVAEKGELDLTDIKFDGKVLSGRTTTREGNSLPGGWEMKLTSDDDAEVRVTGDDVPEQQKKLVVKLHRKLK